MNSPGFFEGRKLVRWGFLGCGDVAEVKSGPAFAKAAGSAVVAVMRRDPAKAADYAARHGVPRWYAKPELLLSDPEVDAVYVATPPETHCHYALRAAAAGKPAYVEKPMARNAAECDRMVEAFGKAGIPLFVAYYRRRLPRFMEVQDLIETGAIGRVTGVRYHFSAPKHDEAEPGWRREAALSGGGLFLDMGSHALDLIDFLFGTLVDVSGAAANVLSMEQVEDTVAMCFRTGDGIPGCAAWNFASGVAEDSMTVVGARGRLAFSVFGRGPIRLENAKGATEIERPTPEHIQQPLVQSAVDDLLGRGSCPSTGLTARRTSRVMDSVLAAYYGGREDEFWRRPDSWPGRRCL